MLIGGFQKFSLIDYPGKISAVIFTQGCNFRCPYCHNPELVDPKRFTSPIPVKEIWELLEKRKGLLEGIVITGGEPFLQKDLLEFMAKIKEMGYAVKVDTNGSFPEKLKKGIKTKLIDFVAMDIKAPFYKYEMVCGVKVDIDRIKESIKFIMESDIDYLFRTVVIKEFLNFEDIKAIIEVIKGAKSYILQNFRPSKKIISPQLLEKIQFTDEEINEMQKKINSLLKDA